ncbi:cell division protein FtsI (penicillin-binding protein 3) [Jatrophihabitans endophyticus]|uniref:Cell division protein FtsI (Penicillin-binding protein 3) n=1 Tax=Jatrophihabitans endophyticus TaxID=1206085 RepID=A0A1M5L8S3_9ACTN|nr:penicillin-binding protein 2 [Jatrophihabitans endophyticus]SHG61408.1 cell division protein FtsI (penicillin-binding protein 3) [Jatrophihabitans endophyticus]
MDGRLRYGFAAVCTLLLIIGGRLVQLQGVDHRDLAGAAAAQRVDTVTLHAMRGQIVDRDGTPLAYTSNAQDVTVDPTQVPADQRDRYALALAPVLGEEHATVMKALATKGRYAVLATALSPARAAKVTALGLHGIYTQATTQRQYPGGTTGANIVGTVHSDGSGAAGIESRYNAVLAGKDGSQTYSVDNVGNVNPSTRAVTEPARNGATVALTIDQNLQFTAQQLLDADVKKSGARGATMAALDVKTGQVLALASSGTFDARNPDTIDSDAPINPPVMAAFEPGSVQKAITFAAALQERTITPKTSLSVPWAVHMGGVKVSDAWYHPTERFTATGVLAESSNVGTLKIAEKLGPQKWLRYEQAFGVGQKTGVELPGESPGYLPPYKDWSDSTFANLPFGQGQSMTVLQLASIYQTLANDGVRVPPRVVSSVTSADGSQQKTATPKGVRAVTAQTARTVRTMLESVTLPGGTGVKAAIPGYRVAGKTGTAQQPDPNNGGRYSDSMYWDTFAGMVPADNPQFVIAIMVDNPAHGLEGGDVAAPLFHDLATYELQHAQVPPTGSHSTHVPLQVCAGRDRATLPANVC